jgi:hypothetical protein
MDFPAGFRLVVAEFTDFCKKTVEQRKKQSVLKSIIFFRKRFFLRELAVLSQRPIIKFFKNFKKNVFWC